MSSINNWRTLLLGIGTAALIGGAVAAGETAEPLFLIGVNTHFCFKREMGMLDGTLEMCKEAGITSLRDGYPWYVWEAQKGVTGGSRPRHERFLERSFAGGFRVLLTLGSATPAYDQGGYPKSDEAVAAYADYCTAIVQKYRGKCRLCLLWNEWDWDSRQGDAKSYVKLAAAAYPKIKAADPSVTVLGNSVCSGSEFLQKLLDNGLLKYCDGVSYHNYRFRFKEEERLPEAFIEEVLKIDRMLRKANNGQPFPIYLTELGWPNFTKTGGSTEEETGDYIARVYLLLRTVPAVKGLWWYDFMDDGADPEEAEHNFGIVRTDLTPKIPYEVLRSIVPIVSYGKFVRRWETAEPGLIVLQFRMPDGEDVLAAWNTIEGNDLQLTLRKGGDHSGKLTAFAAGSAPVQRGWGMRDWTAAYANQPLQPECFQFTVRTRPFILKGDLSGVTLDSVRKLPFPDLRKSRFGVTPMPEKIAQAFHWKDQAPPVDFTAPETYRSLEEKAGPVKGDLEARFQLSWEKHAIHLHVEVTDDVHQYQNRLSEMWQGDSLQIAFQNFNSGPQRKNYSEYTVALTGRGPQVYRENSQCGFPPGRAGDVKVSITRTDRTTVYTLVFPDRELGLTGLEAGKFFGFSLLVNDNDGQGRKGYLHWGDGIGSKKEPLDYFWIVLGAQVNK